MRLILPFSTAILIAVVTVASVPGIAAAQDAPHRLAGPALTIYQQDLGLVEENRRVSLSEGGNVLRMMKVSDRLIPGSVAVTVTGRGGAVVRELILDASVADQTSLLRAFKGAEVTIVREADGAAPIRERATVLRAVPPLLEVDGKILTEIPGRILFDYLPEDLTVEPSLDIVVGSPAAGDAQVGLRYLTGGLSWRADHVIEIDDTGTTALRTWATLDNATGVGWEGADVTLVAGDVNTAPEPVPERLAMMEKSMAAPIQMDRAERQALGGVHLYHLDGPVTLKRHQTKQIGLLSSGNLQIETVLRSEGQPGVFFGPTRETPPTRPARVLVVKNTAEAGLGEPLPAGTARIYRRDSSGRTRFMGEDRLDHTPVGEEARLRLGEAFDVTVDRTQTAFTRVAERVTESAYEVVVRNAGAEPATVQVVETFPGDWRIIEESTPHEKVSAAEARWDITVPANGQQTLTFRVRTTL